GWKPRCPPWSAACSRRSGRSAANRAGTGAPTEARCHFVGAAVRPRIASGAAVGVAGFARQLVTTLAAQAGTAIQAGVLLALEADLRRHGVELLFAQVHPATSLQLRRQRQVAEADTDKTRH